MGNMSHTVGGDNNLVSFKSAARVPITSLKASFLPKQDLHGHSKPWIGGTGKNLFNINASEQDTNTINTNVPNTETRTFIPGTYNPCASWSNYRDPSRIISFSVNNNIISICSTTGYGVGYTIAVSENTQYAISATIEGNGGKINIAYYDVSGNYISDSSSSDNNINNTIITTPANAVVAVLILRGSHSDVTVNFSNIQFEKGTTITSYEPWENICPIEGWNSCEIYHTGKNLFNKDKIIAGYYISNGTLIENEHYGYLYIDIHNFSSVTISGCYNNSLARFSFYTQDMTYLSSSQQKPRTLTIPNNAYYLSVSAVIDTSFSQYDLNTIQVEDGDVATKYEAFQNEIPVTFPVLGKNLFNINAETEDRLFQPNTKNINKGYHYKKFIWTTINNVSNVSVNNNNLTYIQAGQGTGYGVSYCLKIISNKIYTLNCSTTNGKIMYNFFNSNYGYISTYAQTEYSTDINLTFTAPENAFYLYIHFCPYDNVANQEISFTNIQLEYGDTATTYESYSSNNTVYGGYIDVAKGELIEDIILRNSTLNTPSWNYNRYNERVYGVGYRFNPPEGTYNILDLLKCNCLPIRDNDNYTDYPYISVEEYEGKCYCMIILGPRSDYPSSEYNSSSQFVEIGKAWINAHPELNIVQKKKVTNTYYLSPIQLTTLLNQNTIYSNTNGNTEVSYAVHDSAPMRAARARIAAAEPHIATVSGSIASFNTDMVAPIKSAKIYFNPVQEGMGDPSPSNVRAISGWNKLLYSYVGNNLIITQNNLDMTVYGLHMTITNQGRHIMISGTYTRDMPINMCSFNTTGNPIYLSGFQPLSNGTYYVNNANQENLYTLNDINNLVVNVANGDNIRLGLNMIQDQTYNLDLYPIASEIPPISLNWQSTAGTLYGGYVDLIKGELVQTYSSINLGSINWSKYSNANNDIKGIFISKEIAGMQTTYPRPQVYCSSYTWNRTTVSLLEDLQISDSYQTKLQSVMIRNLAQQDLTESEFKSFIDGLILYFPLQTPIIHQLTPQQLKSLKGINNIWSNANGPVEIQYYTH